MAKRGFRSNQPRDARGRWTTKGSNLGGKPIIKSDAAADTKFAGRYERGNVRNKPFGSSEPYGKGWRKEVEESYGKAGTKDADIKGLREDLRLARRSNLAATADFFEDVIENDYDFAPKSFKRVAARGFDKKVSAAQMKKDLLKALRRQARYSNSGNITGY